MSYLSNNGVNIAESLGHFPPNSNPLKPACFPSLRQCSTVVSLPSSGISSLVHEIGLTPSFTLILILQIIVNVV